jgi:hypothetical protein
VVVKKKFGTSRKIIVIHLNHYDFYFSREYSGMIDQTYGGRENGCPLHIGVEPQAKTGILASRIQVTL